MSPPVQPVTSDERLPAAVDVVVIGGGIIGASATYYLAKRGVSVALVEKGRVGGEQSSRNWGYCRQQGRDVAEVPLIRESLAIWGGLQEEIGAEVGFRRTGLSYVTDDPAVLPGWEKYLEHAREYQIHSRMLSAAEAQALTPDSPRKWIAGLQTPSDGRAEPALAAPAIAEAARRLGATVHQSCAARGLETSGGRVSGVVTERGTIRTGAVLCAGGAWASLFCRRHGVEFAQLSGRGSVLATSPAAEVVSGGLSTPGFSMKRRLDGGYNVAISGRMTYDIVPDCFRYMKPFWPAFLQQRRKLKLRLGPRFFQALRTTTDWKLDAPSPFEAVRVWDPAPDGRVLEEALGNLRATFPALRDVTVKESWGGMIDITPDAVPVIAPIAAIPGFYLAAGFSGHGFGIGPGAGRLAADLVSGATPIVDPTPFRYERLAGARIAEETLAA